MFKSRKRIQSAWMRGLMFGRALGAKQERERIVELLEEVVINWRKCDLHNQADTFDYAIALIKGKAE